MILLIFVALNVHWWGVLWIVLRKCSYNHPTWYKLFFVCLEIYWESVLRICLTQVTMCFIASSDLSQADRTKHFRVRWGRKAGCRLIRRINTACVRQFRFREQQLRVNKDNLVVISNSPIPTEILADRQHVVFDREYESNHPRQISTCIRNQPRG